MYPNSIRSGIFRFFNTPAKQALTKAITTALTTLFWINLTIAIIITMIELFVPNVSVPWQYTLQIYTLVASTAVPWLCIRYLPTTVYFDRFYVPFLSEHMLRQELAPLRNIYQNQNREYVFGYDLIHIQYSTPMVIQMDTALVTAIDHQTIARRENIDVRDVSQYLDAQRLSDYDIIKRVNQVCKIKQTERDYNALNNPVNLKFVHNTESVFMETLTQAHDDFETKIIQLNGELDTIKTELASMSKPQ